MARRRKNPLSEDLVPITIGAIGGGLAIYLYFRPQLVAYQQQNAALASGATTTTGTGTSTPTGS
jgi:hypothetical protein